MAGEIRDTPSDLINRLQGALSAASFFQIVRLINQMARRSGVQVPAGPSTRPREDTVRFKAALGMRHPSSEITSARLRQEDGAPELTVSFMGLTGPTGVLPDYYTELVVQQRQARRPAAAEFFDLFNHRTISLFYRTWAKYRLPVRVEEAAKPLSDDFSQIFGALIGLGLDASRPELVGDASDLLGVAGPLARRAVSPGSLQHILMAMYGLPVLVEELQGRWVSIGEAERTRLTEGKAGFSALGLTAVLGAQVWDIQGRFRLRFGPMGIDAFRRFFSKDDLRDAIVKTVELAMGHGLEFDMQLVLRKEEVPAARLGGRGPLTMLGRTSWMIAGVPDVDADDAIVM